MAMVTCPKCKKIVSNASNKCPNCGGMLSYSAFDKNAPKDAKLHMLSNVTLVVSCLLLILDFFGGIKTYVGGLLFGVGFMFQGMSQLEREKQKGFDGKKRGMILIWISAALFLIGVFYLYMDLR